jgi:hypothetical protein
MFRFRPQLCCAALKITKQKGCAAPKQAFGRKKAEFYRTVVRCRLADDPDVARFGSAARDCGSGNGAGTGGTGGGRTHVGIARAYIAPEQPVLVD